MSKGLLIFFCLLISYIGVVAQPVYTWASNPVAGDSFVYYNGNLVLPGATGASVTWDYSSFVSTSFNGGKYDACSSVSDCSTFPGSNFVFVPSSPAYQSFYIIDTSRYSQNGSFGFGHPYVYSNPMDILRYPVHYTDHFVDSFVDNFSNAGFNYLERGYNNSTVDGWGTLKLPNGTFRSVLRIHSIISLTDSVLNAAPFVTKDSTESYSWFAPGCRETLFFIYRSYQNGNPTDSGANYTGQLPTSEPQVNLKRASIVIYPNPVTGTLNVSSGNIINQVTIFNLVGQKLFTHEYNSGRVQVEVANLPAGIYFARINGTEVQKFVKE
jgi:hypothetical protein